MFVHFSFIFIDWVRPYLIENNCLDNTHRYCLYRTMKSLFWKSLAQRSCVCKLLKNFYYYIHYNQLNYLNENVFRNSYILNIDVVHHNS